MPRKQRQAHEDSLAALERNDPGTALSILSDLDDHPAVVSARAAAMAMSGQVDKAILSLDGVLLEHPDDTCLLQQTALYAGMLGMSAKGAPLAKKAWELDPTDSDAGVIYGMLLVDPDEALGVVEKVHAGDSKYVPAAMTLAALYVDRGSIAEAVPVLEGIRDQLDVEGSLSAMYLWLGRTSDYLRTVHHLGLLPPGLALLAEQDDPEAAFHSFLGLEPGQTLMATIQTSEGALSCELYPHKAPVTVANFVGLATGRLAWTDPVSGGVQNTPMYTDTVLHRVIPGFMIQGGDPLGVGSGGPGWRFHDEIHGDLVFDQPGRLAMANSGPSTNGSQFFVTEVPTPHLDGRHTIFGTCDEASLGVLKVIGELPRDAQDKPVEAVRVERIVIGAE